MTSANFEDLRRVLNLSETITDEIEAEVTETYNLKPRLPTAVYREERDKEVWRLLKATVVAAACKCEFSWLRSFNASLSTAAALESTKFLKRKEI